VLRRTGGGRMPGIFVFLLLSFVPFSEFTLVRLKMARDLSPRDDWSGGIFGAKLPLLLMFAGGRRSSHLTLFGGTGAVMAEPALGGCFARICFFWEMWLPPCGARRQLGFFQFWASRPCLVKRPACTGICDRDPVYWREHFFGDAGQWGARCNGAPSVTAVVTIVKLSVPIFSSIGE